MTSRSGETRISTERLRELALMSFTGDPAMDDDLYMALRELAATRREWQPIETAPKSGIGVLLWQPWKSGRDCTVIGHYANGWVDRNCDDFKPQPTHWMPLPAAPSPEQDGKGEGT